MELLGGTSAEALAHSHQKYSHHSLTPCVKLSGVEVRSDCNRHRAKSCSASPGSGNALPDCGLKQAYGVLYTAWLCKVQFSLQGVGGWAGRG